MRKVILTLYLIISTSLFAQNWEELEYFKPSSNGDALGHSVAISGNYAIVGAPSDDDGGSTSGSAYIYKLSEGNWTQMVKLNASDADQYCQFGYSVAISGNYAIVGAYRDSENAYYAGAAYIYKLSDGEWTETDKIMADDGEEQDCFGVSVSISGSYAFVGAYIKNNFTGAAYVFSVSDEGLGTQVAKLVPDDVAENDYVGYSVSISGNYAIVGIPHNDDTGSAYIYELSGGAWTEMIKLTASDAADYHCFGWSVFISGNYAIVGAYQDDDGGAQSGSAYIYELSDGAWTQIAKLTGSRASSSASFGYSVSISSDYYSIIGAQGYSSYSGAVYIFGDSDALPVELTSFTASLVEDEVQLNWQTATEVNNYGFQVQRNTPLSSPIEGGTEGGWEDIGFVNGNGNSNSPKSYSYTDTPTGGTSFKYRLKQIDFNGAYEYSDEVEVTLDAITEYSLEQNYPNPFNPTTTISYQIPVAGNVTLKIYDVLGKEVITLVNETQASGVYNVEFNASQLASGVYIYRLSCNDFIQMKKLLLMK
ncbi:MAG: T9SS type A sorting domain-containing protein [Ignavibacteria bacterium]|jgi:hypothetical protein